MRDDQVERIKLLSEEIADDMVSTAKAAIDTDIKTKVGRGDKSFLYGIVKNQAGVMATLQRVLDVKSGKVPPISATAATQEKYEQQLIKKAEEAAAKLKQRLVGMSAKWDPSSGKLKSDISSTALVLHDDLGNKYWHRSIALTGPDIITDENGEIIGGQVWQLCDLIEEFHIPKIVIETNGIGGFAGSSLKAALKKRKLRCGVEERHASQNKNKRILESFEGPLMSGLLWAHISVLVVANPDGSEEDAPAAKQMREWNPAVANQPDDYMDSAAGAIVDQPERVGKIHRNNEVNEGPNWRGNSGVVEATLDFEN